MALPVLALPLTALALSLIPLSSVRAAVVYKVPLAKKTGLSKQETGLRISASRVLKQLGYVPSGNRTAESVVLYSLGDVALLKEAANALSISEEALANYLRRGDWIASAAEGHGLVNQDGIEVPARLILGSYRNELELLLTDHQTATVEKQYEGLKAARGGLAKKLHFDPGALDRYLDQRDWFISASGNGRGNVQTSVNRHRIIDRRKPFVDGDRSIPAEEILTLVDMAEREHPDWSPNRSINGRIRAYVVDAIATYLKVDAARLTTYLKQNQWRSLAELIVLSDDDSLILHRSNRTIAGHDIEAVLERYFELAPKEEYDRIHRLVLDAALKEHPELEMKPDLVAARRTSKSIGDGDDAVAKLLTSTKLKLASPGGFYGKVFKSGVPWVIGNRATNVLINPFEVGDFRKAVISDGDRQVSIAALIESVGNLDFRPQYMTDLIAGSQAQELPDSEAAKDIHRALGSRQYYGWWNNVRSSIQVTASGPFALDGQGKLMLRPFDVSLTDLSHQMLLWLKGGPAALQALLSLEQSTKAEVDRRNQVPESFMSALLESYQDAIGRYGFRPVWSDAKVSISFPDPKREVDAKYGLSPTPKVGQSIDHALVMGKDLAGDPVKENPSAKWTNEQRTLANHSPTFRRLLEMEGLKDAKRWYGEMVKYVYAHRSRRVEALKPFFASSRHAEFVGNEGTGRGAVAELYGHFRAKENPATKSSDSKAKDEPFDRISIAQLDQDGRGPDPELLKKALKDEEGVLLLEGAHLLAGNSAGGPGPREKQLANMLADYMSDPSHKRAVIVSGTKWELQTFHSAFPRFDDLLGQKVVFDDLTDQELKRVLWKRVMADDYMVSDFTGDRVIRYLRSKRGDQFANAAEIDRLVEAAIRSHGVRVGEAGKVGGRNLRTLTELTVSDFDVEKLSPKSIPALVELDGKIGLKKVKQALHDLFDMQQTNTRLRAKGVPVVQPPMHGVIYADTGMGKTMVATLIAKGLAQMGYLSKGDVIPLKVSDLMSDVVGGAEMKMKDALERAKGNVLLIDGAHGLYQDKSDIYGKRALQVLTEAIQPDKPQDFVVMLTGYKEPIEKMLTADEGLGRRFAPERRFLLEPYTMDELGQILRYKANEMGVAISDDVYREGMAELGRRKARRDFGNAGEVETMLQGAIVRQRSRLNRMGNLSAKALKELTVDDLLGDNKPTPESSVSLLDDMVGLAEAKEHIETVAAAVQTARKRNEDPLGYFEPVFILAGGPGTGKTTWAKELGRKLHRIGFLDSDEVKKINALELTGDYEGQTKTTTREILESALGKTLLIDEAYSLGDRRSPFKNEAITRMMDFLSEHYGELAVAFIGYPDEIKALMRMNKGMARRVPIVVPFRDLTSDEAVELLSRNLNKKGLIPDEEAKKLIPQVIKALRDAPGWSNGGDVETFFTKIRKAQAVRVGREGKPLDLTVVPSDLNKALKEMLDKKEMLAPEHDHRDGRVHDLSLRNRLPVATDLDIARTKPTTQREAKSLTGKELHIRFEQAMMQSHLSPAALLDETGLSEEAQQAMAKALGRDMTTEEKTELKSELAEAVKVAPKTGRVEWVCSRCFNSNPWCPYKPMKDTDPRKGGFLRPLAERAQTGS